MRPLLEPLLDNAMRQSFAPGLYVVATPIGNLADLTVRAAAILARSDRIYCEDTRTTRRLLDAIGIRRPLASYHDHNGDAVRPEIIAAIAEGRRIAVVSDAGTPVISDPGFKLVRDVAGAGHRVFSIPGPSAVTAAASVAGLATDTFLFLGFLPPKSGPRRARFANFASTNATLLAYESPQRLAASLSDAADILGDRNAVVARELTKAFEETRRGCLLSLVDWARETKPRGEFVILIGPPEAVSDGVADDEIESALLQELQSLPLGAASKKVAKALGVPRRRVYELGLAQKSDRDEDDA